MKRLFSHACALLAALTLFFCCAFFSANAANGVTIDTSSAKNGFVTVNYTSRAKLKVGVQFAGGKIVYKDCPSGRDAAFPLERGDGSYTITLCENLSGKTYRVVCSKTVNATIENQFAPYLVATSDVQFTSGDAVSKKAAELCKDCKSDEQRVVALYNYVAGHYSFDAKLADSISEGKVTKYIPDTAATLESDTGICYDLASLFAALCRSQGIPCSLTKGYAGQSYHAWNKVNLGGSWYPIDLTHAVTRRVLDAEDLAGCVSPLSYRQESDTLAVSAVK